MWIHWWCCSLYLPAHSAWVLLLPDLFLPSCCNDILVVSRCFWLKSCYLFLQRHTKRCTMRDISISMILLPWLHCSFASYNIQPQFVGLNLVLSRGQDAQRKRQRGSCGTHCAFLVLSLFLHCIKLAADLPWHALEKRIVVPGKPFVGLATCVWSPVGHVY